MKSFFEKKRKVNVRLQKAKTEAFSLRNIDCNGFVFHREDDSQWKRKRPETEVSGPLVEISGIEPLTS